MTGEPRGQKSSRSRNGKLAIPLPFDEAMKAALEVKPPKREPRKPRSKNPAKPYSAAEVRGVRLCT